MAHDCVLIIRRRGDHPVGVTATYGNGTYIGAYRLSESQIKALREGQEFQGMRVKRIRDPQRR